jgi:hypothetical protein
MTLLLQCLRDVRTLSGDLDLLPPSARGDSLDVRRLRSGDDLGDGSLLVAVNPPSFATGSPREPDEERH